MSLLSQVLMRLTNSDRIWAYFDERALFFLRKPYLTQRDLAYVSSRDYRVWPDEVYEDSIEYFREKLSLSPEKSLLEIGCAAGFWSVGLSRIVREYWGVDLAPTCLTLARRATPANAHFKRADATALPFADGTFDSVLCTDFLINIPDHDLITRLIREMERVTKAGGRVLVAMMNDTRKSTEEFSKRIEEFMASLPPFEEDHDLIAQKWIPRSSKHLIRLRRKFGGKEPYCPGSCRHDPEFFVGLGQDLKMQTEILPVNRLHPYYGFRFSVLYRK